VVLEHFGKCLDFFSKFLENFGNFWKILENFGKQLENFGNIWKTLENFETFSKILEN